MNIKKLTAKPSKIALAVASIYLTSAATVHAAVVVTDRATPGDTCNWSATTCWEGGSLPGADSDDNVGILGNDIVTLDITPYKIGMLDVGSKVNKTYPGLDESGELNIPVGADLNATQVNVSIAGDVTYDVDGNESTRVTSKINQTGGAVQVNAVITTNSKKGTVLVTKGSLTLGGNGTLVDTDADGTGDTFKVSSDGQYSMSSGSLTLTSGQTTLRSGGLLNISGDASVNLLAMRSAGELQISGSEATVNFAALKVGAVESGNYPEAEVLFTLDETGVSPVTIAAKPLDDIISESGLDFTNLTTPLDPTLYDGNAAICTTNITIDGSSYTGDSASLPLITADAFTTDAAACIDADGVATNSVEPKSITITGFADQYQVNTTQSGTALTLNIDAIVANSPTVISFTDPLAQAELNVDELVALTVEVTDADGIDDVVKLEFFDGDTFIAAGVLQDDNKTFSANWTPTTDELGDITLKAVATDSKENTTTQTIAVSVVDNSLADTDGDGVPDLVDAFPNDPNESVDTDGDGTGDNGDAFPEDPTETVDTDDDGTGDNSDAFPEDPTESADTDGDGTGDNADIFPEDPTEQTDSDGDGVGDNGDYYPNDPEKSQDDVTDSDNDGTPDLYDAFPDNPEESADTDGDGVGDNADAFPEDPEETTDTDGDGVGDNKDDYPDDASKSKNLRGTNPVDFVEDVALAEAYLIPSDATSLNVAAGVVVDCQRPELNLSCISGDSTVLASLYILNEGTIEVSNDDVKTASRAISLDGSKLYGLTNGGAESKLISNDSTVRLDDVIITDGIINQGLISTGSTTNNAAYVRSAIELASSANGSTTITGGISNSGTIQYLDEDGNSAMGYAIRLGHQSKTGYSHSVDFIDNSGTINGDIVTSFGATISAISNSGTINGHVGTLKRNSGTGQKVSYIVDNFGNATTLDGTPAEDYEDAYNSEASIVEVTNSGVISGVLAFDVDNGGTYTSQGGSVGSIRNASTIIVDSSSTDAETSNTINSHFDFAGELNFKISNPATAAKAAEETPSTLLVINGDANLSGATLTITNIGDAFVDGSSFTLLTVNSIDDGNTPGTLLEEFSSSVINAGNTYFEISLTEDGTSLIATAIDPTDSDEDGVPDVSDEFPNDPEESVDTDGDGTGNNADTDDDNDGVDDEADTFPLNADESVDTDGDGTGNNADNDDDGDGVEDEADTFPLDASESVDTDGDEIGNNADSDDDNDGVEDELDIFPLDASETADADEDGVGDNADYYDDDPTRWQDDVTDSDNDGTPNLYDAFPDDATETVDSDGDGVGDNGDQYPDDATESKDSDGDDVGDNADAFPNDATETLDSDEDGVGNNADKFPFDSTRTEKTDTSGGSFGYLLGLLAFIRVFKGKQK